MAHQHTKGRYHPSRISDWAKKTMAREYNKLIEAKKKYPLEKLDLNKQNWSTK